MPGRLDQSTKPEQFEVEQTSEFIMSKWVHERKLAADNNIARQQNDHMVNPKIQVE